MQLVLVERHAKARAGRQVDAEIREAQWLFDQIVDEDLWAEMLATPGELAQPGKDLQMRRGADRALQQATTVKTDPRRLGHRRDIARGEQTAVLDELERDDSGGRARRPACFSGAGGREVLSVRTPSEIKSEWWATSSRIRGRFPRNLHR